MHLAGRPAGAQAEWKRALAVVEKRSAAEPDRADFLRWRALLLAMTGQRDEAEKIWRLSVDLATEARAAAHIQAEYLLASGKRDEAITRLESSKKHLSDFFVTIGLRYNPWFAEIRDDPRIQALIAEAEARLAAQRAVGQPASEKSVAVLAFKNLSGDPAREFVSDGLSEAVALVLGGVPGLKVVGSASAFSFKGKNTPIPEIARQLGVSHVVEGTVLQDGQNVRVTAKLIQADGFQVGAPQKVDRELKNILALHDEVAGLLAKNLSLSLNARSAASTAALDPEAYQLYLEGMQAWSRRSGIAGEDDEVRRAQDLLGRALKLAPDFARAQATLADTWLMLYDGRYRNFSPDAAEFGRRARQEVERALALDPELVETQAAHARLLLAEQRYEESAVAFERAIRLNPNYAYARQWYGRLLCNRGRLEEGLAEMKIATQLDPLSPIVTSNYALYLSLARRWPEVMTVADRVLALAPDYGQTLGAKGYALIGLARFEEARQLLRGEATRKRTLAGDLRNMTARLLAGERGDLVQEAEARLAKPAELRLYDAVRLALALGRTDEAFRFARERPGDWRIDIALHFFFPGYDSVRSDHRFRQWLEDAGCRREYEQAWAEHLAWRRRTGSEH
jgi:TolB-like protein/Tfp pilus assembly protein PilF